ncbi:uncharacterized protein LOC125498665 [Beta vulgaris subsp. vulgaris]|uniref:uncharacterized protein LOC125498665 n=1 Tax=Beta vulgaris subsp. vulgaris TaxID=3555 RepID=UPI0020370565|nr:uncharacterized protein LOC125498665 [Beta vulgaris subsp. vulgaris]
MIEDTVNQVRYIREKMRAAQDRQKAYADQNRRDSEYQIGEKVLLKVSLMKGMMCFGQKGKLIPKFIGPYDIIERIGRLAYRLDLPNNLEKVPKSAVPPPSATEENTDNIRAPPLVVNPSSTGDPTKEVELSIAETLTPVTTPEPVQGGEEEEPWKVVTRKSKGKQVSFHSARMQHHVEVCALFGTRVREPKAMAVKKKFGASWSWVSNYDYFPRGRIWIGWKPGVFKVSVTRMTEQCVIAQVTNQVNEPAYTLIAMYGLHSIADRRQLWLDLRSMVEEEVFPYFIIGDFNTIYQAIDRVNGALVSKAETRDFSEFIMEMGVMEAPCTGAFYSWSTKAIGERISSRIDAAFINKDLLIKLASSNEAEFQLTEKEVGERLRHWSSIEDNILRQKARISWINLADSNTKFYFNVVKIRKARNAISVIQNSQGEMLTRREDIQAEVVDFYKNLMGTCASSLLGIDLHTIRSGPQLGTDARAMLSGLVIHDEIDQALFSIDDNKAPGIDGFDAAGFIPGRTIADNILLATELIKGYSRAHASPRCVIKVDIKKAYDSVEWSFLERVLVEMSFPNVFQMDYDMCLGELKNNPDFNFHPKCERLSLTQLMFADDSLLFSRADVSAVTKIMVAFNKFSYASSLVASLDKSNIYIAWVMDHEAGLLAETVPLPIGELPFKYLGVPLASKKLNFSQCKILVDKITKRAQGWIAKNLSYAGRLQLVRSILSSMQNYWAQLFSLPKKLLRAVEAVCRKFLWTGKTMECKKAPVAWNTFYIPRVVGGWNLINMEVWNKAAILKLLWALAFEVDKLWVQWVNEYYMRRSNVYTVVISNSMSRQLKKILASRATLQDIGGWNAVLHYGKYSI